MPIVVDFILNWFFCDYHSRSRATPHRNFNFALFWWYLEIRIHSVCQFLMIYNLYDMFRIFVFVALARSEGKKSNTGAIVGGVIGGILFLILIGVGVFFFLRWKSKYNFMLYSPKKVFWRIKATFLHSFTEYFWERNLFW